MTIMLIVYLGLCILLYRLRYPNRYCDWTRLYGREPSEASFIFNWMLDFVFTRFGHLLQTLDHWWLQPDKMAEYAKAISDNGCPLPYCFGFLDGMRI